MTIAVDRDVKVQSNKHFYLNQHVPNEVVENNNFAYWNNWFITTTNNYFLFIGRNDLSRLVGKPTMWFPNRSDTNRPVQAQKRARRLKFRI